MNKTEFVNFVSEKQGVSKAEVERAIKIFTNGVSEALQAGHTIQLVGFGTYAVDVRDAREARNLHDPKAKPIKVDAKVYPKFSFGKPVKESVADKQKKNVKKMLKEKQAKSKKK